MNNDQNDEMRKTNQPPPIKKRIEQECVAPLSSLLKDPECLIHQIGIDKDLPILAAQMLLWGLAFHAIYGLAMALFGSLPVALVTAWKAPLIAFCSLLLCIPSLYVFSCVAGMPITISQAFAFASTAIALTGLLLLGLTPVTWLFSVSTNNLAFVVIMNLAAWCIAIGFSLKFFDALGRSDQFKKTTGLKWWLLVYIIVSLQMATTMRPLLGKPEKGWRNTEKKFFLAHLKESMSKQPKKKSNIPAETRALEEANEKR